MKKEEKLDISYGEVVGKAPSADVSAAIRHELKENKERVIVIEDTVELNPQPVAPVQEPEVDPYANAVEAFFAGYQAFQEGMQMLTKVQNPRFLFNKLVPVLEGFQSTIATFKEAQYEVPAEYQAGQDLLLEGIKKYDVFLVEYPAVLQGKGGLKAMKKVTKLGKLSADADQEMKKAFKAFDEATQGA